MGSHNISRGTDNAALASVLGALDSAAAEGAVTNADLAMAYIKQLVTLLLNGTYGLSALETLVDSVETYTDPKVMGKLQIAATTIDLAQAAATYDLFTGATQNVVVEKLLIRLPNVDVSDDANIASISIQTNDTTNQVFLSSTDGAKANLTAEAQLGFTGVVMIKTGKKIQLTIAGGAADAATVCDVIAEYRAVVAGGYLA